MWAHISATGRKEIMGNTLFIEDEEKIIVQNQEKN